jgi:hypothetical protein
MFKFSIFTLGIATGIYLGINLREQGFAAGITRSWYAFKNEEYGKRKPIKDKNTIDDVFDYFRAGLLDGKDVLRFKEIMASKRGDKIDEFVLGDIDKVFNSDPYLKDLQRRFNSRNL